MKARSTSADTAVILEAMSSHAESARNFSGLVAERLADHVVDDDRRFAELTALVTSVGKDTRSLLDTRTFTKGMWRALVLISGAVSGAIALAVAYLRTH